MAIEETILSEKRIIDILNFEYSIKGNIKIVKLNRGNSNLFKINVDGNKYILKEFNTNKKLYLIKKEMDLIQHLKEKEMEVPEYIKLNNGEYYLIFKGKILILQKFIEGRVIENNTGEYKEVIQSAKILGELLKNLNDYKGLQEEGIIEEWFSRESLQKGIQKIKEEQNNIRSDNKYKKEILRDFDDKIRIANELINKFDFNIIRKLTIMNTHGDYSIQQLIYNKERIAVLDFETAKKMPIVWEIMRSYSYIDKKVKGGEVEINNLISYFKEVSSYVKLNKYDLKYAPYIYLIQLIVSTFGYREYNKDYTKKGLLEFGIFRTNLSRNLYKNLEYISKELLDNIEYL